MKIVNLCLAELKFANVDCHRISYSIDIFDSSYNFIRNFYMIMSWVSVKILVSIMFTDKCYDRGYY